MKIVVPISKELFEYIKSKRKKGAMGGLYFYEIYPVAEAVSRGKPLTNEPIIKELEKLKEDILKRQELTCDCNCNHCGWFPCVDVGIATIVKKDINTIDKHIKELKEEKK